MSGIVAAAQSAGCCCRPSEGCVCGNPNRPGAVFDRQLTAISVTGEATVDHAILQNGSPQSGCGCDCFAQPTYGSFGSVLYGYQSPGSITDPDFLDPGDPCYPGCTHGACNGCPTFNVSASTSTIVCEQSLPGVARWSSRNTQFGDNFVGQWSWRGRQVGYCTSVQGVRVRRCCLFEPVFGSISGLLGGASVDPCGAFVDPSTGEYVNTQYGPTLGRLHAIQTAELDIAPTGENAFCHYELSIGIGFMYTWEILRALDIDGFYSPTFGYSARYRKPCLAPTDTVLGRYELVEAPQYDRYSEDQECGRIRAYEDLRVGFPQFIEVT